MATLNDATASEKDVAPEIEAFNEQILGILKQTKARMGSLTQQAVHSLNLSADRKNFLAAVVTGGVFEI